MRIKRAKTNEEHKKEYKEKFYEVPRYYDDGLIDRVDIFCRSTNKLKFTRHYDYEGKPWHTTIHRDDD